MSTRHESRLEGKELCEAVTCAASFSKTYLIKVSGLCGNNMKEAESSPRVNEAVDERQGAFSPPFVFAIQLCCKFIPIPIFIIYCHAVLW